MSILFTLDDFTKVEKVTMPWAGETYFIPAGTPMSADGIANDGNAIGILAENARLEYEYDYGTNPYGKVDYTYSIITHGYVNTEDAEASFGGTYSDACRSALSNIVFCDNHKIGGGGGGMMVAHILYNEDDDTYSCDKTFEELYAAFPNVVIVTEENGIGGYVVAVSYGISVDIASPNTDFVSGNLDGITFYHYFIKPDNTVDCFSVSNEFSN